MSDKLYNLDFVNSMAGGNQDFINQLLTLFVDSVPESIDLINALCQQRFRELGKRGAQAEEYNQYGSDSFIILKKSKKLK